ncbi:MAG TPA: MFS transporter [Candidatus Limnocylindrales bacterium]|nr:MFS transporter [Candidatus Limnocylindrales bacterium]
MTIDPRVDLATGRPVTRLPNRELVRISLYWLGLSSVFAGLSYIMASRLEFAGLVDKAGAGRALFLVSISGAVIAVIVQPTIGSISDYTITRWGRRKPYIFIGSLLDLVFLVGIAYSDTLIAIAAFVALLQFSSNFAQGPFQGYVPDLVPAAQVGTASALVGMMQILGVVSGYAIGALAAAFHRYEIGLIAIGVLEVATMLSVVVRVREGPSPKSREGRPWRSIAAEAWGTDILREHSFLWLVASRLAILMGGSVLTSLAVFYLARTMGLDEHDSGLVFIPLVALVAVGTVAAVVPAARISDRVGRKRVIWASCAVSAIGLGAVASAPSLPFAFAGALLYGISAGMFLSVDWALMTDIIPKASSGRYMGLSNVATASAGVLAIAIGGTLMDLVGGPGLDPSGPRAALWLAVVLMGIGALLLRPVDERRREDGPLAAGEGAVAPAVS